MPEGYRDFNNVTSQLREWAALFPDRAMVVDVMEVFNGGETTPQGNGMFALKISDNVEQDEDEPNILLTVRCRLIICAVTSACTFSSRELFDCSSVNSSLAEESLAAA